MVVKVAGALLDDAAAMETLARQVAQLAHQGHEILVVHGGGKIFTGTLQRMGIESKFVNGLRVTDRETRDVAVMVLGGLLNKRLAGAISGRGTAAIGICASDSSCFLAEPMMHNEVIGGLGFVGYLTGVNLEFLESFWKAGLCRWRRAWASAPMGNSTTSTPIIWRPPAPNIFMRPADLSH